MCDYAVIMPTEDDYDYAVMPNRVALTAQLPETLAIIYSTIFSQLNK
jgi:hypothetical protein